MSSNRQELNRPGANRPEANRPGPFNFKSLRLMKLRFGASHSSTDDCGSSDESAGYRLEDVTGYQSLRANLADRWLALLTSSLLLLLTINTALLLIWWGSFHLVDPTFRLVTPVGPQADFVSDPWADWDEVPTTEFPELLEPQLSDTVVRPVVMLEEATGTYSGDPMDLRLKGEPLPIDPGTQRWVIRYRVFNRGQYRKMLAAMRTQLAYLQDAATGRQLVYLDLASGQKTIDLPENEHRGYFHQTRDPFLQWDRRMMQEFGMELEPSQTVLHFHSPETLAAMQRLVEAQLENDGRTAKQIQQAEFRIDSQQTPMWSLVELRYVESTKSDR